VDGSGRVKGPVNTLQEKANPAGGLAAAAAGDGFDGGALAWVALEEGRAQLHVTRIDGAGRRVRDARLSTTVAPDSDVTIQWGNHGFIVAWVDNRVDPPEIYATKVSPTLQRISREERVSKGVRGVTGLTSVVDRESMWLAWADTRGQELTGVADIFAQRISAHDGTPLGPDVRVSNSPRTLSRSPSLAVTSEEVAVAWIEDVPWDSSRAVSDWTGAMAQRFSRDGEPKGPAVPLVGKGAGRVSSVAWSPGTGNTVVAVRQTSSGSVLEQGDFGRGPEPTAWRRLAAIHGPVGFDVPLAFAGAHVIFGEDGPRPASKRVRLVRGSATP
jgi:hypothetical protein